MDEEHNSRYVSKDMEITSRQAPGCGLKDWPASEWQVAQPIRV